MKVGWQARTSPNYQEKGIGELPSNLLLNRLKPSQCLPSHDQDDTVPH
jgi:hypothetical protein